MEKITEIAVNRIRYGGGSGAGKREGTAIPAGELVDRIYFNTSNTIEETNAILSQLTYTNGAAAIYSAVNDDLEGHMILATQEGDGNYYIFYQNNLSGEHVRVFFGFPYHPLQTNGWDGVIETDQGHDKLSYCRPNRYVEFLNDGLQAFSEFDGILIGHENEKIKNVLSITPF